MIFGLRVRKNMELVHSIRRATFPLLTHSRIINGNPVETCGPYPRDYMSETI
jgi:hypothetical protein